MGVDGRSAQAMRHTKLIALMLLGVFMLAATPESEAKKRRKGPDYGSINVPEEGTIRFERLTTDNDCVSYKRVGKNRTKTLNKREDLLKMDWWANPQIAVSPDGSKIAYINQKNETNNVMVKPASAGGASVQRTFRTNVFDFSWSPDGNTICFTEYRDGHFGIYLVDATQGNVVRQITNSQDNDYAGKLTNDGNEIFFHRGEGRDTYSIWSYDRSTNLFSNYSRGMSAIPDPYNPGTLYCARFTNNRESEIWRINTKTGVEEIILSIPGRSFTTPQLSPNGHWLIVTGSSFAEKDEVVNTDIFAVRTDGTDFTQLTYHPGNDLSGVWAPDGNSIFFLSQRGSGAQIYNVWKMSFDLNTPADYRTPQASTPAPAEKAEPKNNTVSNTRSRLNGKKK